MGTGHVGGVVFGRGRPASSFGSGGVGGELRRRVKSGARRRSMIYEGSVVLRGGDFGWSDMDIGISGEIEGEGMGDIGGGARISMILEFGSSVRDVSYAMIVSNNWRNMMSKSSATSCVFDGT